MPSIFTDEDRQEMTEAAEGIGLAAEMCAVMTAKDELAREASDFLAAHDAMRESASLRMRLRIEDYGFSKRVPE